MSASKEVTCAWCGATFFADKRHKYCSEACYEEAHREQARLRFRKRFAAMHEQELARNRDYHWRNKEKPNARCRNYYLTHATEIRENRRNYYIKRKKEAAK